MCVQVWGVSSEDTLVLVRTGITPSELAGRTWKPISLPITTCDSPTNSADPSSSTSQHSSLGKVTSPTGDTSAPESINVADVEKVLAGLTMKDTEQEEAGKQEQQEKETESGEGGERDGTQKEPPEPSQSMTESTDSPTIEIKYPEDCSSLESSGMSDHTGDYVASLMASQSSPVKDVKDTLQDSNQQDVPTVPQKSVIGQHFPLNSKEWSESRLRHASTTSSLGSLGPLREEVPVFNLLAVEDDHLWLWVTGGGCWIKANTMPKW